MNHVYRLVWNASLGLWTAVAETARARGKRKQTLRGVVAATLLAGAAQATPPTPPPSVTLASGHGGNATTYVASNGTTVVNISTPNSAGLSVNYYQQYNVNSSGLVLNNDTTSTLTVQSQLAGQLYANLNLSSPATVILNEVVGNNRSTLAGFTEVLGNKADVVVANPYGITCSGCGFINTDRVTLSTGTPLFNSDGSLSGLSVAQGDILVNGTGLNGSGQQILDLVTRAIEIQAPINAQDLGITAGNVVWDYSGRSVTGAAGVTETAPVYAIDSSVLGGMYANRIHLIATENGVGVRLLGDAAATAGDFSISASGKIELADHISAQQNINITTTNIQTISAANASLSSTGDMELDAGSVQISATPLVATGKLTINTASLNSDSSLSAGQDLDISSTGAVTLTGGALLAGGALNLSAASLSDSATSTGASNENQRSAAAGLTLDIAGEASLSGTTWQTTGGSWQAQLGNLDAGGTRLLASAALGLSSADALNLTTSSVQAGGNLGLGTATSLNIDSSSTLESQAGSLTLAAATLNNNGTVSADSGAATVQAGSGGLNNTGKIHSGRLLSLSDLSQGGSENISNSGSLISDGGLSLLGNALSNTGSIQAASGSSVQLASLDNSGSWLFSTQQPTSPDSLTLGSLSNEAGGTLQSAGDFTISGNSLNNSGLILASGNLTLNFSNASSTISNTGNLQAGSELGLSAAAITLNNQGKLLGNSLNLSLNDLDNSGTIQGGSSTASQIAVSGTIDNESSGLLKLASTGGSGIINASKLQNDGSLQSDGDMNLNIGSDFSVNSPVVVLGNLNISGNGYTAEINANLQGSTSLTLNNASSVSVNGANGVIQGGALSLGSSGNRLGSLNLANGAEISAQDGLDIYIDKLVTDGNVGNRLLGAMGGSGDFTLDTSNALDNYGMIYSGNTLTVNAPGMTNEASGGILAQNTLTLNNGGTTLNNYGSLYAKNQLDIYGGTYFNNIGTYAAAEGNIKSDGNILISAYDIDNSSTIDATNNITLSGTIILNKNVGNIDIAYDTSDKIGDSTTNNINNSSSISDPTGCAAWISGCSYNWGLASYSWDAHFTETYKENQYFVDGTPFRPEIVSEGGSGTVSLSFVAANNYGGLISGNTVNLSGFEFTNTQITLQQTSFTHSWDQTVVFRGEGPLTQGGGNDDNDTVTTGASTQLSSIGAGLYAQSLTGSVFAFENNGNLSAMTTNGGVQTTSYSAPGQQTPATASGTLSNIVGANALGQTAFQALTGINIILPTSPNGYFVPDLAPNAQYLIETNPLLGVGSSFVGASFLENELGINPDSSGKLVGDNNYQAYLIQQELIAQTGNDLLNSYNSLAAEILALENNAATESSQLGLTFGVAPTPDQLANLGQDMVWMVKTEVDGQLVLTPVVYLSPSTHAGIATGAVVDASNIDLNVGTLVNNGGSIEASNTMAIVASGDIVNSSGSMSANNMALVSTGGQVIDQTVVNRYGDADNYQDVAGKTAGITATNNLVISGNQGVDITGATVSAGNSAVLASDQGNINITSLALSSKSTTTTSSSSFLSSSSQTTVDTNQTLQQASVTAGGNGNSGAQLTLLASNGAVNLASANLGSSGDVNIKAQDINSGVVDLTSSHSQTSSSSGISASNGSLNIGSSSSSSSQQNTVASGSNIQAGGALNMQADNNITLTGGSYAGNTVSLAGNNIITQAAANSSSSSSSSASAGLTVGNGSLSAGGSNSNSNASGTQYSNAQITGSNGVALAAKNTVDIGGADITVKNAAPPSTASNSTSSSDSSNASGSSTPSSSPAGPLGLDVGALNSALASGQGAQFIAGAAGSGLGTAAAMSSMAQPQQGQLSISGAQITSTKYQDTYQSSSSSSSTSIGIGGSSQSSATGGSATAGISFQNSNSSATENDSSDNINHLSGDNISLQGNNSINLRGVDIEGGSSVSLQSNGDINISAAQQSHSSTQDSSSTSVGIGVTASANANPLASSNGPLPLPAEPASLSASLNIGHTSQTDSEQDNTHQDSTLSSGGTLNIQSGGNVNWTGVTANADTLNVQAKNFTSAAYQDSYNDQSSSSSLGIHLTASTDPSQSINGLLNGNGTDNATSSSAQTQQVGNTLSANTANIDVANNVTIVGGNLSANNFNIQANTVDLQAAKSTDVEHQTDVSTSLGASGTAALAGYSASGSVDSLHGTSSSVTGDSTSPTPTANEADNNGKAVNNQLLSGQAGLTIDAQDNSSSSTSYQNSNLQFNNLNIDTRAAAGSGQNDGHVDIGGANLLGNSGNSSINIATGQLDSTKYTNTSTSTSHDNSTFIGMTTEAHSAIADTVDNSKALADKANSGMSVDAGMATAQGAADASDLLGGDLAGASVAASVNNTDTRTQTSSSSQNINYLNAGNINITTTQGDINLNGVQFGAASMDPKTGVVSSSNGPGPQNIALNSAGDVNVTAAKSTSSSTTTTLNNDASLTLAGSVSVMGGAGASVQAGYNGSTETDTQSNTNYTNSQINGANVSIKAQNLNLTGANVSGGNVNVDVAHDINITSVQDTQQQNTSKANWGGGAGIATRTIVAVSAQGGGGSSHDNYAKTATQSGIDASNNLDVNAGGNLTMTGAQLASAGGGSVNVKGNVTANKLNDSEDQNGLFVGASVGVASSLNAGVTVQQVDQIHTATTQNSTISGVGLNVGGKVQGDNLQSNGQLQTQTSTVTQDQHIAGVYIDATYAQKPSSGKSGKSGSTDNPAGETTPTHSSNPTGEPSAPPHAGGADNPTGDGNVAQGGKTPDSNPVAGGSSHSNPDNAGAMTSAAGDKSATQENKATDAGGSNNPGHDTNTGNIASTGDKGSTPTQDSNPAVAGGGHGNPNHSDGSSNPEGNKASTPEGNPLATGSAHNNPDGSTTARQSQYDSNVVIVTRGKDGKIDDTVQASANALAAKHPENTIVLTEKEDGSLDGLDKLSAANGQIRVNTVGHGSDLKGQSDKIVGMVDQVRQNAGDGSTIAKVGIVACGGCSAEHGNALAKDVATGLGQKGIDTTVTGRSGSVQVNDNGTKSAYDGEGQQSYKYQYSSKDGDKQPEQLAANHQELAALDRPLTFRMGNKTIDKDEVGSDYWNGTLTGKVAELVNSKKGENAYARAMAKKGVTQKQLMASIAEMAKADEHLGTLTYDALVTAAIHRIPGPKVDLSHLDTSDPAEYVPPRAPGEDAMEIETTDHRPILYRKNSDVLLGGKPGSTGYFKALRENKKPIDFKVVGGREYHKGPGGKHGGDFVTAEGKGAKDTPDNYEAIFSGIDKIMESQSDLSPTAKNQYIAKTLVSMFTKPEKTFSLSSVPPELRDSIERIYVIISTAETGGRSTHNMAVAIAAFLKASETGESIINLLKNNTLFVHTDSTTGVGGSKMSKSHWDGNMSAEAKKNPEYQRISNNEYQMLMDFAAANKIDISDYKAVQDFLDRVSATGLNVMRTRIQLDGGATAEHTAPKAKDPNAMEIEESSSGGGGDNEL